MENLLEKPIRYLKGIGPKKEALFQNLDIYTLNDLFHSFPREYEDRGNIKKIADLVNDEAATFIGQVIKKSSNGYARSRKQTFRVMVKDNTGLVELLFFNAPYIEQVLEDGKFYYFFGVPKKTFSKAQMVHPEIAAIEDENAKGIFPIYHLTKGITQKDRRKVIKQAFESYETFEEYLPNDLINKQRLCDINYAMNNIHFPKHMQSMKESKYRLIFEEFLVLQTGLSMVKNKTKTKEQGILYSKEVSIDDFVNNLPFKLTNAQEKVVNEIILDMETDVVMNRLLQGDVGSGKTAVAAIAIYKAVKSSYQAVMMAPTEILARQHLETLESLFGSFDMKIGFLSGSMTKKKKEEMIERVKAGEVDILLGTHALLEEGVSFKQLGLVITDEQHRFGVKQRSVLQEKGVQPDVMVMTATPIPRTLALILYGDLDISVIDELPAGRKEIKTSMVKGKNRSNAHDFLKEQLNQGRQGFIVAPLIEDSDVIEAKSVESLFEELSIVFNQYKLAYLHGKMKQKEKDKLMTSFKNREIDVLLSTIVIEVGINVPNASVMIIENTERFGLAQLHQLRGRVGRGEHQSYCILVNEGKGKIAQERAKVMTETNDGFIIAEKDLEIRGPGDFFGLRQHGLPEFKIANMFSHMKILKIAQQASKEILLEDPLLEQEKNRGLAKQVSYLFNHIGSVNL